MNLITRIIAGVLFFLLSVTAIFLIRINPKVSTPTRSNQTRMAGVTMGLLPGKIITQELTAIKDYMSGIELFFTHSGRNNTNENTLLLLDSGYFIESFCKIPFRIRSYHSCLTGFCSNP